MSENASEMERNSARYQYLRKTMIRDRYLLLRLDTSSAEVPANVVDQIIDALMAADAGRDLKEALDELSNRPDPCALGHE